MAFNFNPQAFSGGNLFIDGIGCLGVLKSFEPPKIEHEIIEQSNSIGKYEQVLPTLKPLSAKFVVSNVNAVYFNTLNAYLPLNIYIKNNLSSDGLIKKQTQIIATFNGSVKILELPKYEPNKEAELSFEMAVHMFSYQADKAPLLLYDVINSIYAVNGVDQYLEIRKNIQ
ncbi:phage tail protein [Helicobacter sp. 12S02232-10]|uniref:phage major tail tube protein n=1 Tax=Helicobacter sp. 12S02232-10 TaxID=1476197 RepID=UPI000BA6FDED|nr:phage major tail tube protein [Helicobacter sp. 12S02232-10]PAF49061.1 phage tail protein [Helicobacter sp. 12S02232-10]